MQITTGSSSTVRLSKSLKCSQIISTLLTLLALPDRNLDGLLDTFSLATELGGSQVEVEELRQNDLDPRQREGREVGGHDREGRRLTVWSTSSSTLTVTSTSYLAGTTITASALCAGPGVVQGCFGK